MSSTKSVLFQSTSDNAIILLMLSSFLGGVISSSLLWRYISSKGRTEDDYDNSCDMDMSERSSFLKRWMSMDDIKGSLDDLKNRMPGSLDDIKTRIGELPGLRRRSPWPWDRKKKPNSRSQSPLPEEPIEQDENNDGGNSRKFKRSQSLKSDLCIGSIFGLDVGGTLAKLVYFEQKVAVNSTTESIGVMSNRERFYRTAASAQAVLMARRGLIHKDIEERNHPLRRPQHSSLTDLAGKSRVGDTPVRRQRLDSDASAKHLRGSLRHSKQSTDDLLNLQRLRQESVPDDLEMYAETVLLTGSPSWDHVHPSHNSDAANKAKYEEFLNDEDIKPLGAFAVNSSDSKSYPTDGPTLNHSQSGLGSNFRKSRSMLDFSRNRAEALDHFYNFARRLDSYRESIRDDKLSFYSRELQGEFHFIHFETRRMQQAMDLIRTNRLHLNIREMGATGGGAHKFAAKWEKELGIAMKKQDELDSLVAGLQFVLSTVVGECYSFRPVKDKAATAPSSTASTFSRESSFDCHSENSTPMDSCHNSEINGDASARDDHIGAPLDGENSAGCLGDESEAGPSQPPKRSGHGVVDEWWWSRKVRRDAISYSNSYPYMVVSIGTGVSILRVDGPRKYERISGSTIGGGTYWGLIRLLTDVEDFEDVMKLAAHGDPSKVDMMVGDIYGDNSDALEKLGLPADLVAASFGKLVAKEDPAAGLKQEDLARALLLMITINIGQVAFLNAKLTNSKRIYFVGNFLRQNKISQRRLAYAIDFWSKGEMEALFLEHEGYFGALGAFLISQNLLQKLDQREWRRSQSMYVPTEDMSEEEVSQPGNHTRRASTMGIM